MILSRKKSFGEAVLAIAILSCIVIGWLLVAGGTLTSIGYFLYLWAHGATAATAAWLGFVLWLKMVIGGSILFILGSIRASKA